MRSRLMPVWLDFFAWSLMCLRGDWPRWSSRSSSMSVAGNGWSTRTILTSASESTG